MNRSARGRQIPIDDLVETWRDGSGWSGGKTRPTISCSSSCLRVNSKCADQLRPPPACRRESPDCRFTSCQRFATRIQEATAVAFDHSETDGLVASTRPTNACSRGDAFRFFQIRLNGSRTSISTTGSNAMPLGHCHRVDSVTQAIPIWHWTRPSTVSRSAAS